MMSICAGMAAGSMSGHLAVSGKVALPLARADPLKVSAGSGLAAFVLVLIFFRPPAEPPKPTGSRPPSELATVAEKIGYGFPLTDALNAVNTLKGHALATKSDELATWVVFRMKPLLQDSTKTDRDARTLRVEIINAVKAIRRADFRREFQGGELEGADLVMADFRNVELGGVSFKGAFLIESDFSGADLVGVNFAKAHIRNAKFVAARLAEVDLTEADWFNALGLTEGQLRAAKRGTVARCPPDNIGGYSEQGFAKYLPSKYGFPFESWSEGVQMELKDTWREYGKSNGLCSAVGRGLGN